MRLAAVLQHAERPLRDSVTLHVSGVTLPSVDLAAIGGRLRLGQGTSDFSLGRLGDQIDARLKWVATGVSWERLQETVTGGAPQIGSTAWARDLLWRTLSGLQRVEVEMRLRGSLDRPALSVSSNVGQAVVQSLRREVGREIERAEQLVRTEVDRLLQPRLAEARSRVDALEEQVQAVVGVRLEEVKEARALLESELQKLTKGIPGINIS